VGARTSIRADLKAERPARRTTNLFAPRVVIELDGAQHLEITDAYRRDRRKDQLLQQNGYFVLRFLAEDVGKNLNMVLDTIQRTLFCRQKVIVTRSDRHGHVAHRIVAELLGDRD
jgi:hypothetical protein